jgi:hypothetical protein
VVALSCSLFQTLASTLDKKEQVEIVRRLQAIINIARVLELIQRTIKAHIKRKAPPTKER